MEDCNCRRIFLFLWMNRSLSAIATLLNLALQQSLEMVTVSNNRKQLQVYLHVLFCLDTWKPQYSNVTGYHRAMSG